jgi:hypothetical protein
LQHTVDLSKTYSSKILPFLLIGALPLLSMTQLRLPCCGIGPGEILLIAWVICSLFVLRRDRVNLLESDITRALILFWLFSLSVMAIGAYFGHSIYQWDYSGPISQHLFHGPIHDTIAYLGLMLLTVTLAAYKYTWQKLQTTMIAVAVISAVLMYGLLILKFFGVSAEPFTLVGHNASRFSGFARNPNQAALLIIFVPPLITAYIESNEAQMSRTQKLGSALVLAISWLIGLETRSTAFQVSILVWFFIMLFLWLSLAIRKNTLLNPVAKILALSVVIAVVLNSIHQPIKEATEMVRANKVKALEKIKIPKAPVTPAPPAPPKIQNTYFSELLEIELKAHKNAFEFRGRSTDPILFHNEPSLNFPGDFTVELWFLTPLEGGEHRLFSHWGYGGYIGGYGNGKIFAGARNLKGIHVGVLYSAIPAPNVWHHFAYTRSGSTYRLFIDGKEVDSVIEEKADKLTLDVPLVVGAQGERHIWHGLIEIWRIDNKSTFYKSRPSREIPQDNHHLERDYSKNFQGFVAEEPEILSKTLASLVSETIKLKATIEKKSDFRFILYRNGFLALSHSPIVGLGPGPYSGDDGPFERREVHNSFVDWLVGTGLLGGIAIIVLFFWSAYRLLSARCYSLFGGFIAVCLFAQFHHVIRHPIVWIFLILALKIADLKSVNLETN